MSIGAEAPRNRRSRELRSLGNRGASGECLELPLLHHTFANHDSIVIVIHPDEEAQVINVIDRTNAALPELITTRWGMDFNVPLLLEAKIGPNWLDTKDVT